MTNNEFFEKAMSVQPKAFYLIAEHGHNFISDSIQAFEEIQKIREKEFVPGEVIYNHIAGLLPDENGELIIYQSGMNGFEPTPWKGSEYDKKQFKYVFLEYINPLEDVSKERIKQLTLSLVGTPYDFAGIAEQVGYTSTGIWTGPTGEDARKRLFCSEAWAYIYFHVFGYFPYWWKISPEKLVESGVFRIVMP